MSNHSRLHTLTLYYSLALLGSNLERGYCQSNTTPPAPPTQTEQLLMFCKSELQQAHTVPAGKEGSERRSGGGTLLCGIGISCNAPHLQGLPKKTIPYTVVIR